MSPHVPICPNGLQMDFQLDFDLDGTGANSAATAYPILKPEISTDELKRDSAGDSSPGQVSEAGC